MEHKEKAPDIFKILKAIDINRDMFIHNLINFAGPEIKDCGIPKGMAYFSSHTCLGNLIMNAFDWDDSPEGRQFWSIKNKLLREYFTDTNMDTSTPLHECIGVRRSTQEALPEVNFLMVGSSVSSEIKKRL